jgi:hypothetical protein
MALAVVLGISALARDAAAYVRYKSKDGQTAFAWPQSCIPMVGYPENFTTMMTLDEITNAANGAANAWSAGGDSCTDLDITVSMTTAPSHAVSSTDHENSLVFRTTNWCLLTADGSCDPTSNAYSPEALALTSVSASTSTGHIKDADIEVNGFFHWADLVAHPELNTPNTTLQDLQNALTHEMGHLIGLDHTCVPAGTTPRPVDNLGNPVPDCNTAPPEVVATTMFPSATPGDTSKRTLEPDDQQAVCDIYPAAMPLPCVAPPDPDPSGCGCGLASVAPVDAATGGLLALGCFIALGVRRRRGGDHR